MNLRDGLPTAYEADGVTVRIHTGASVWMRISRRLEEAGGQGALDALESAVIAWERAGEEVLPGLLPAATKKKIFGRLFEFLRGGEAPEQRSGRESKGPRKRLIDYDKDMAALYAAFLQVYRVDLYACVGRRENGDEIFLIDVFHWWKFLALLNSLPPGNTLRDYYMHYRGLDLSKLPAKTAEDKQHKAAVAEIQRRVSLDAPPAAHDRKPSEARYAARARALRDEKSPAEAGQG